MSASTETTDNGTVTVNGEMFADCMGRYVASEKLVDALIKSENPEESFSDAMQVISDLRTIAVHGGRYNPPKELGLGSDNSATIAGKLLGLSASVASIRKIIRAKFKV